MGKTVVCAYPCSERYRGFESHSLRRSVCCSRDFPIVLRHRPKNSAIPRGLSRSSPRASGPETAGSGPIASSWSRLSLLPSLAVRFRFRFAPQGIPEFRIPFAPPTSLRLQRPRTRFPRPPQKLPRFRGVLREAHSRIRTGDAELRADSAPLVAFVSVARFGGSDSLQIHPAKRL